MNNLKLDRRDILPDLSKRLDGFRSGYRQNIALLGEAGLGKTTLLKQLIEGPLREPDLIPVYVETGESENLVEWSTRFIRTLLYAVLQSRDSRALPDPWSDLLDRCDAFVPGVTAASRKVLELAEAGRSDLAYQQIWDLPHLISQDLGCRVVLLMDEFHRLRVLPIREPFRVLGRKIMVQNSVLYLVVSSEPTAARKILREGLDLLFGQFETVEVRPLGAAACLKAVRSAWPEGRHYPFCESLVVDLGQGRPELLILLLEGLRKQQDSHPGSDPEQVLVELLERFFLEPDSVLRRRFESTLRSLPDHWSRLYCAHLLATIAGGVHRIPAMVNSTGRSAAQVRKFLSVLEEARLVIKEGTLYHVPERLFRLWLVTAYPALQGVGLADPARARARFREAVCARMEQYRTQFRQTLEERIAAWMRVWAGDRLEIDGKRTHLPRWDTIRRERLACGLTVLLGREKKVGRSRCAEAPGEASASRSRGWVVVLSEQPLSEGTACQLVEELARHSEHRGGRKFLIPLCPMEINTRLVLQQGKVKVWDLSLVNHLLDLYGMTRVLAADEPDPVFGPSILFPPAGAEKAAAEESRGAAG